MRQTLGRRTAGEVYLSNTPASRGFWRHIARLDQRGIPKLAAVLECTSDKKSDDWKCTAVCVFRVHSSKHGRNMRRLVGGFSDDFDAYWTNNYVSIEVIV